MKLISKDKMSKTMEKGLLGLLMLLLTPEVVVAGEANLMLSNLSQEQKNLLLYVILVLILCTLMFIFLKLEEHFSKKPSINSELTLCILLDSLVLGIFLLSSKSLSTLSNLLGIHELFILNFIDGYHRFMLFILYLGFIDTIFIKMIRILFKKYSVEITKICNDDDENSEVEINSEKIVFHLKRYQIKISKKDRWEKE